VVVVAYRKATIGLADEVVFLADGRVADRGTHEDLLTRNPAYADLVNAYENATAEAADRGGAAERASGGERSEVGAR
jgi:ABC-type transport system involved in cytochrome bd biosynthesis fused ATPase/permease subunit